LKTLLEARDEELASWDLIISEEQSINARLKKEVFEANEQYNRFADQLESRSRDVQNKCSKACKNAEAAVATKGKLEAKVERLVAKKNKALKAHELSESLLIRLRVRYGQCKAKTKCLLKQLSYVPCHQDQSWGRGFNWGFENFQTLTTNH
jgi:chromosome segregation ATPase